MSLKLYFFINRRHQKEAGMYGLYLVRNVADKYILFLIIAMENSVMQVELFYLNTLGMLKL